MQLPIPFVYFFQVVTLKVHPGMRVGETLNWIAVVMKFQ